MSASLMTTVAFPLWDKGRLTVNHSPCQWLNLCITSCRLRLLLPAPALKLIQINIYYNRYLHISF